MTQEYKFLDNINFPSDLRKLSENELEEVSNEVRKEMISAVSETGGHLGAGLGVVELTVALHYIFDINKRLKKYGSNSKNIKETLYYILDRDK